MKNKNMWLPVALLVLFITLLCWILGCMMYNTNLKEVYHNITSVEYMDSIENIRYSMHFGKKLETFSGMDEFLKKSAQGHPDTEDLYIVTADGQVLFSLKGDIPLPKNVASSDSPAFSIAGGSQYSKLAIDDGSYFVVKKPAELLNLELVNRYIRLGIVALMGLVVTELLILLAARFIGDEKKSTNVMVLILALWITGFSSYVGVVNWRDYDNSIGDMKEKIADAVTSDIAYVEEDLGVDGKYIGDLSGYLVRFPENVPEIKGVEVTEAGEVITYTDKDYLAKKGVDYILQTALFLVFSMMILAEYRMFLDGLKNTNKAKAEPTNE